jgi:hypothetical protein
LRQYPRGHQLKLMNQLQNLGIVHIANNQCGQCALDYIVNPIAQRTELVELRPDGSFNVRESRIPHIERLLNGWDANAL